jgi:hypothetical protein
MNQREFVTLNGRSTTPVLAALMQTWGFRNALLAQAATAAAPTGIRSLSAAAVESS